MRSITTNFEFLFEAKLYKEVWDILKKYNCSRPYLSDEPTYLVEIEFFGDIEESPTWARSIWIRFCTSDYHLAREIRNNTENVEVVKELEKVVKQYFSKYEGIWELKVWAVTPL